MVAGDFEEIYGAQEDPEKDDTEQWDAVLTCFFIDTVSLVGTLLAYYSKLR